MLRKRREMVDSEVGSDFNLIFKLFIIISGIYILPFPGINPYQDG